jgi:hypothetical protein
MGVGERALQQAFVEQGIPWHSNEDVPHAAI